MIGEASGWLPDLEKLKGEGRGENAFSEDSVVGDPQPKKVPSREEPGDLGSGLSVLGVLMSLLFLRTRDASSDLSVKCCGRVFRETCRDIVWLTGLGLVWSDASEL